MSNINLEINNNENDFILLKTFVKREENKIQSNKSDKFQSEFNFLKGDLIKERDPRFWFDKIGLKTIIHAVDRSDYLNLNRIAALNPLTALKFHNVLMNKKNNDITRVNNKYMPKCQADRINEIIKKNIILKTKLNYF